MCPKKFSRIARAALVAVTAFAGLAKADLVGYWNFDDNTDDQSAYGNHGSLVNGGAFDTDVPPAINTGKSLLLGGGSYVFVPHSDSLNITSELTIATWVQPLGDIGWDGILAKNPSDGSPANHAGNYELRIEDGSRLITFLHQNGGVIDTTSTNSAVSVANGLWQHLAVTVQKNGQTRYYLDGSAVGVAATAGGFGATNTQPLYIGSRADLFTSFDGRMDDVRIYSNILSPAEIATLANVPPPEPQHPGLSPIIVRASSEFTGDGRLAVHAVNGNGINGKTHVNNSPPGGLMWLSDAGDVAPTFEIDLGGVHNLADLRLYNYNENADAFCCLDRGINEVDLYVAGPDLVYGAVPAAHFSFARAPGTTSDFSELKSLAGLSGRYIKLAVLSNHGDPSYTGISEVKVTGTPVPGLAPLTATVHSVSSNLVGFNRPAFFTVDRSGMGFGDTHSPVPDGSMWLSQGTIPNVSPDQYDVEPEITFDLGAVISLSHMKVWNYNEYFDEPRRDELLGRGIAFADIYVAGEDLNFTLLIQGQEFERAPADGSFDFGQAVDLLGASARYVKFDILSNHLGKDFTDPFDTDGFNDLAGLSEVQFFSLGTVPVDVQWNVDGGGTWGEATNWLAPTVPDGAGHTARFGSALVSGDATITLDGDRTVGAIYFDNANSYHIVAGTGGILNLQNNGNSATITVDSGSHAIGVPVSSAEDTLVTIADGSSLTLEGGIALPAGRVLVKYGAGELASASIHASALAIQEGTVRILPNGSDSGTSRVDSLFIAFGGTLDLTDNHLVVQATSATRENVAAELTAMLALGRNGGIPNTPWTGSGITSSSAAANTDNVFSIGIVLNDRGTGDPLYTTFGGEAVDTDSVLIRYTYSGDSDLNGIVDADDYFQIDSGFSLGLTGWFNGDFDYSGLVDADDYFLIDSTFLSQTSNPLAAGVAAIPEPASMAILLIGVVAAGTRRRKTKG